MSDLTDFKETPSYIALVAINTSLVEPKTLTKQMLAKIFEALQTRKCFVVKYVLEVL